MDIIAAFGVAVVLYAVWKFGYWAGWDARSWQEAREMEERMRQWERDHPIDRR